jgi:Fe2+ transport system protein FeoA
MNVAELALGTVATVTDVGGQGSFRRRLMELGILPGTRIEVVSVAPLGDPLEILVRGASLSIRKSEALLVQVSAALEPESVRSRSSDARRANAVPATASARGAP